MKLITPRPASGAEAKRKSLRECLPRPVYEFGVWFLSPFLAVWSLLKAAWSLLKAVGHVWNGVGQLLYFVLAPVVVLLYAALISIPLFLVGLLVYGLYSQGIVGIFALLFLLSFAMGIPASCWVCVYDDYKRGELTDNHPFIPCHNVEKRERQIKYCQWWEASVETRVAAVAKVWRDSRAKRAAKAC